MRKFLIQHFPSSTEFNYCVIVCEPTMTSRLLLYNFFCLPSFTTSVWEKQTVFYFCSHFHKKFISGSIYHQSIIYEQNNEVCCCCLECRPKIFLKQISMMKKKRFFTDLEKNLIQYCVFNDCVIMENFSKKVLQEEVKLFYSFAANFEQPYTYR